MKNQVLYFDKSSPCFLSLLNFLKNKIEIVIKNGIKMAHLTLCC
jgi:hypothetical protein